MEPSRQVGIGPLARAFPQEPFAEGVDHRIVHALAGQPINDETIAKAAAAAKAIAKPITDMRGTAEFRTHITGVLVERVLKAAVARAKGEHVDCRIGH